MKRQRPKSPVSENTLVNLVACSSAVEVIDNVIDETDSFFDSPSQSELFDSDIIDDSDNDPTFDPNQPSTSATQNRHRPTLPLPRPRPTLPLPRPRPNDPVMVQ
ncbi:hypothetical protein J6590_080459 [Homalodisca vitripennis]|nr:hypothetical protein J6590_080459 [Homalodisca vitripennis]